METGVIRMRPASAEDLINYKEQLIEIMDYSVKMNAVCPKNGGVLQSMIS